MIYNHENLSRIYSIKSGLVCDLMYSTRLPGTLEKWMPTAESSPVVGACSLPISRRIKLSTQSSSCCHPRCNSVPKPVTRICSTLRTNCLIWRGLIMWANLLEIATTTTTTTTPILYSVRRQLCAVVLAMSSKWLDQSTECAINKESSYTVLSNGISYCHRGYTHVCKVFAITKESRLMDTL